MRSRRARLARGLLLAAGCVPLTARPAAGAPLPAHAVAVASYEIDVRLDPDAKALAGRERIAWTNPSSEPVAELRFHLYLNAFRNSQSTFFLESGGQLRGDRMPDDGWGWTDVTSLRTAAGADLTAALRFEHPDDGNALDRTVASVRLPEAVPPGGSVTLELAWTAQLPRIFARTGWAHDYFLVGQWFPKLGVYEPAGRRGRPAAGWNCHQFHAHSEFYADFGRYRVAITLPRRFVVGATGARVARRENADGTSTHVYEQADVIDFAWTASPRFLELRSTFRAEHDVTPAEYAEAARRLGRPPEEVRLSDVEVLVLLQPGHLPQAGRHVAAAKAAIKWFGLWYGRYPYPTLTVVDPGPGGAGSGGMEYPTFITAGTSFLLNRWPLAGVRAPEFVTVHEFGHQYWQSMVATNEFEESWLDEGFNSYSTGKVMEKAFGPWLVEIPGLRLGVLELSRLGNNADRVFDRIRTPSWGFSSPGNYSFNSYGRTELTLRTLEAVAGEPTVERALRAYHERWRFAHPSSDDFFATPGLEPYRGFFEQTVERPGIVDYEVASVDSQPVPPATGRLEVGGKTVTVGDAEARRAASGTKQWRSVVLVRRRGEVVLPTELELRYQDGRTERLPLRDPGGGPWTGRWRKVELTGPQRVVAAVLDPDDRLVLDVNRLNDGRRAEPDGRAAAAWGTRWVFWLQQLLALVGL
jgi:hypothetical protein